MSESKLMIVPEQNPHKSTFSLLPMEESQHLQKLVWFMKTLRIVMMTVLMLPTTEEVTRMMKTNILTPGND